MKKMHADSCEYYRGVFQSAKYTRLFDPRMLQYCSSTEFDLYIMGPLKAKISHCSWKTPTHHKSLDRTSKEASKYVSIHRI